ncbi:Ribosomal large subunit pseudouridine synthase A [Corynebacterium caspium DSM 44850]|nr:Ribosomal large subunit pseudouridine synthase A [Corynebacterium caspium DSM 44850]
MSFTIPVPKRRRRRLPPLPIRDGLNPTRVRTPDAAPIPAATFLIEVISSQRHRHPADNTAAILERFAAGEVRLHDGTALMPTDILAPGTDIWFYRQAAPEPPVPYEIPVIYEDERILVVHKPPFLATMPRGAHIVQSAVVQLRKRLGIDELSPAHRLDRLTSGLLLFTKAQEYRGAYQSLFAAQQVHKTYTAIAPFKPFPMPLQWASHLSKEIGTLQAITHAQTEANAFTNLVDVSALDAVSQAKLEAIYGKYPPLASYTLQPLTGRTHQLRVHMWQAGVPILGDPIYPQPLPADLEDFAKPMHLTATALEFTDPITKDLKIFKAAPVLEIL